jgi:cysteine-rich repeat protein
MKRLLLLLSAFCFLGCPKPPIEAVPPFIHVTVTPPAGSVPPVASDFTILVEAIVEGNLIQKVIETPTGDLPLPLDFVILFSEEIRRQAIDISVTGFADGVDVFSGVTSGFADVDDVILVVNFCGDGQLDEDRNEVCDEGLNNSDSESNACRLSCVRAGCGDGVIDAGEDCDDANRANNDGCDASCIVETGFNCIGEPSACLAICGDGLVLGAERCDDGNAISGDGCSEVCAVETGFKCAGQPSDCGPLCGDGLIRGDTTFVETCDDGNRTNGDGCNIVCLVENNFTCVGEPSVCTAN